MGRELEEVKEQRSQQRQMRHKLPFPTCALVGYTSAGKSTILNLLSGAEVLADRGLMEEIWEANPLLRNYLGSIDNPDLIVYRITPRRVRYMKEWALEYHEIPIGPTP